MARRVFKENPEVRLDGWCEGGLRQQRNDGICCATMRERSERVKTGEPWHICNKTSFTRPFLLGSVFFRTALPCSGACHMERGGMPLHHAVGINCKKGITIENQGSGVKYMV